MIFEDVTLILPDGNLQPGFLRVRDGIIAEIGVGSSASSGEQRIDGRGGYLAPGFIDLHVHGGMGRDAMEADPGAFRDILRFHTSGGTTALALTSVAAPLEDLCRVLEAARAWQHRRPVDPDGAELLGIHLEGPYFSPARAGAHRLEFLREPDRAEYGTLLAFRDVIMQMTLAPELPGALELIDALVANRIIASAGHSDASDEQTQAGLDRGMEQVTHLFNAMSSARRCGPRRIPGLVEFALAEPRLRCELIADGIHVAPTLLRLAYRAKGAAGICLITDASPGTGLADGSRYKFAGTDCIVRGGACLTSDETALAGSCALLIDSVRNMVSLGGATLSEAIRMATVNPARALQRADTMGQLAVGRRADLVLLTPDLHVAATYVAGRKVFGGFLD